MANSRPVIRTSPDEPSKMSIQLCPVLRSARWALNGLTVALTAGFSFAGCVESSSEPNYIYLDSVKGVALQSVQELDAGTTFEGYDPERDTGLINASPALEMRAMLFAVSDGCYSSSCTALADGSCTLTEIEPGRFMISAWFKVDTNFGADYNRRGNPRSRGCTDDCGRFATPCGEIEINHRPLEITSDDGEVFTIPVPIEVQSGFPR